MTTALSSSVHPEETNDISLPNHSYRSHIRLLDPDEHDATDELFDILYSGPDHIVRQRLRDCRTRVYFIRHDDTGEIRVSANTCKHRWCLPCAKARSSIIAHNVGDWVQSLHGPKLLTLTLVHGPALLADQIEHLIHFFRRLRQMPLFKKAWRGGAWFLQVSLKIGSESWHPHLHVILDGDYVPHHTIKKAWKKITTTSDIVDIRKIRTPQYAARYVSRYVSRPAVLKDLPLSARKELYDAFCHKRLLGTFGSARGARLLAKPPFDRSKWHKVGAWSLVIGLANTNPAAHAILQAWNTNRPLPKRISLYDYFTDKTGLPRDLDPEPPPDQLRISFDD